MSFINYNDINLFYNYYLPKNIYGWDRCKLCKRLIKKSEQLEEVNALRHLLVGQTNRIYDYENI